MRTTEKTKTESAVRPSGVNRKSSNISVRTLASVSDRSTAARTYYFFAIPRKNGFTACTPGERP